MSKFIDYSKNDFVAWNAERENHLAEIKMLRELLIAATVRDGNNNVVYLHQETYGEIPPDRVLTAAIGKLKTAIVIGYDLERGYYFASSTGDKQTILWLTQMMSNNILGSANE